MHSQDTINQLIELRAEGKSCRTIAAALNISLGAAHKLSQEHDDEIQQLAFFRREAARDRYLTSFEGKLSDAASELQQIDAELKLRTFGDVSTEFLLYRKTCLQARQEKLAHEPAAKPAQTPPPNKMNISSTKMNTRGGVFKTDLPRSEAQQIVRSSPIE